ncbi:MAG: putative toxin-antitoxin system toxin component, PIN family [Treponema sp.]|nr:putative toxin-antitoxin system toxin component, PIN family [Treponema sp.]
MKVVVDTNVIVSAMINANGSPVKILSLILSGKIKLLYDNRIIFEYTEVLSRKEFGFNAETVNDLINYFRHEGEFIIAEHLNTEFSDETDKKFYEVCKTGEAHYLITGNIKHFPKDNTIIIPKKFLEQYDTL